MKKITLVICAVATSLVSVAQVRQTNVDIKNASTHKVNKPTNLKATPTNSRATYWLNYALQLDDPNGYTPGAAYATLYPVFPDSTVMIGQSSGAPIYNWIHKAATMLDPKNMPVQGISSTDAYTLDSVAISYSYTRKLASSVTDTVIVDIVKHDNALLWDLPSAAPTTTYQDIEFDFATQKTKPSNVIASYTIYLTEADSSGTISDLKELLISTSNIPQQAAGNRIGAVVTFKPGYSYGLTDSLKDKNAFYILTFEHNGQNTDPTFYGTVSDGTSDMNVSYILHQEPRYNISSSWNGYFHPTWAFTTGYAAEHHIIQFRVSSAVGVQDFVNGAKLGQNQPNPFSSSAIIKYELEKAASVTLNVFDVMGKLVASQKEGEKAAGANTITFNAENLASGAYYYSIKVNDKVSNSQKMVIVK